VAAKDSIGATNNRKKVTKAIGKRGIDRYRMQAYHVTGGGRMGYEFLPISELKGIEDLPDVQGGVGTPEEWNARRPYLKAMLSHYMLGARPENDTPARGEVLSSAPVYDGLGVRDEVRLYIGPDGRESFDFYIVRPNRAGKSSRGNCSS
jgi:hypothetical protein